MHVQVHIVKSVHLTAVKLRLVFLTLDTWTQSKRRKKQKGTERTHDIRNKCLGIHLKWAFISNLHRHFGCDEMIKYAFNIQIRIINVLFSIPKLNDGHRLKQSAEKATYEEKVI